MVELIDDRYELRRELGHGGVHAAHAGGTSSPAEASKAAEEYLAAHLDDVHTMTSMATDSAGGMLDWSGAAYHRPPSPALARELSRRVEQLGDAVATVLKD